MPAFALSSDLAVLPAEPDAPLVFEEVLGFVAAEEPAEPEEAPDGEDEAAPEFAPVLPEGPLPDVFAF